MSMSEVKIEIPQQLIDDLVRSQIVEQLGNKEAIVRSVVTAAMSAKKDTYSSTPTYFQEAVQGMIRDEAKAIFKEWIETNRAMIRAALFTYLNGDKQKRLKEFCEKLADNILMHNVSVSLYLDVEKR